MQLISTLRQRQRRLPSCKHRPLRRHTPHAEPKLDYKAAGVDIDAGNELVQRIKKLNPEIGGFNGMYPFGAPPDCHHHPHVPHLRAR